MYPQLFRLRLTFMRFKRKKKKIEKIYLNDQKGERNGGRERVYRST